MSTRDENSIPGSASDSREPVARLVGQRVLVIGDLFLDEYIEGRATRLSREAPVPVLEFERRIYRPGGGANPAHNIVALEGQATQVGVIGDDEAGRQLSAELIQAGIDAAGVVGGSQPAHHDQDTHHLSRKPAFSPSSWPVWIAWIAGPSKRISSLRSNHTFDHSRPASTPS